MASEFSDASVPLPEDLDSWLEERASELGTDREELLRQLLAAYRVEVDEDPHLKTEELEERVSTLERRLEQDEDSFEENLEDLRRRVVQVKQELDAKAPAEHGHAEFEHVQTLDEQTDSLASAVEKLRDAVDEHDDRLSDTEHDLTEVRARLDDLSSKTTRVASAVVALQRETSGADRLRDIRQTAAREGYETADCHACGETLRVGLLAEATCPSCGADFADIEPSTGWFGNPTLTGGETDE